MNKKINIAVLFGGKSAEHEVSLQSARNVVSHLDRDKYNVFLIGIDKNGNWHFRDEETYLINGHDPRAIALGSKQKAVEFLKVQKSSFDVIFPVLHGPYGEDGTVQGLLKLANIPFVGAGVMGSAIGLDKDVMKRLARDAGIPLAHFLTIHEHERLLWPIERVLEHFEFPFFSKPANGGSSFGITKIKQASDFERALDEAFRFDRKILLEEAIQGREIECSLFGNEYPIVSLPCEIVPKGEFHSYSSKYLDPEGAEFIIPIHLPPEVLAKVQSTAIRIYQVLCCEGLARVDMFLKPSGEVLLNEINTIPGLTNMSPYGKMWEASGWSFSKILDQLIQLALDRHQKEQRLVTQVEIKRYGAESKLSKD